MYFIIVIIIFAIFYFILSDKQEKYEQLASNPSLNKGIFFKYQLLFEHWEKKEFAINEVSKGEVRLYHLLFVDEFTVSIEIRVLYQASQKLQFIVQLHLTQPVNRYIKTKSFFYEANAPEKRLIEATDNEVSHFIKYTLENLR